jgi:hypothetical protein
VAKTLQLNRKEIASTLAGPACVCVCVCVCGRGLSERFTSQGEKSSVIRLCSGLREAESQGFYANYLNFSGLVINSRFNKNNKNTV